MRKKEPEEKSQEDEIWKFIRELDDEFKSWGEEEKKTKVTAPELVPIIFPKAEFKKALKRFEPQIMKYIPPKPKPDVPKFSFKNYIEPTISPIHPKAILQAVLHKAVKFPSSKLRQRRVEHMNNAYHKYKEGIGEDNEPFYMGYTIEYALGRELFHDFFIPNDYEHWGEFDKKIVLIKTEAEEYLKKREDFIWEEILKQCRLDWIDEHPFIKAECLMRQMKVPPPYEVHTGFEVFRKREDAVHTYNPWIGRNRMLVFSKNLATIDILVTQPITARSFNIHEPYGVNCRFYSTETPVVYRPNALVYGEFDPEKTLEDMKYVEF